MSSFPLRIESGGTEGAAPLPGGSEASAAGDGAAEGGGRGVLDTVGMRASGRGDRGEWPWYGLMIGYR